MDRKSLESLLSNPNLLESNDILHVHSVLTNFQKEVDRAFYQLLKLANIEGEDVIGDRELIAVYKKKLNDAGLRFDAINNHTQPFRLLIQAVHDASNEFIVGYLVDYRPQLAVIRRLRLDTKEERDGALLYLKGVKDNYEQT